MYCSRCGKEIKPEWKHCRYCGAENNITKVGSKRKKKILAIVLVAALIIMCGTMAGLFLLSRRTHPRNIPETDTSGFTYYASPVENIVTDSETGMMFVNNELLITLTSNEEKPQLEQYLETVGGEIVGEIPLLADYQVLLKSECSYEQLTAMSDDLNSRGWVKHASINLALEIAASSYYPNDAKWKNEWSTTPDGINWGVEAIDAPGAWDYKDRMQTVKIGVFDNMFALEHPDLVFAEMPLGMAHQAMIVQKNGSSNWSDHGTHVAGTIAATFDNNAGIAGISPNNQLYGVSNVGIYNSGRKIYDNTAITIEGYKIALSYLILQKHCNVINMSIGTYDRVAVDASLGGKTSQQNIKRLAEEIGTVIDAIIETGNNSFVICVSAGNANDDKYFIKDPDDASPYACYLYDDYNKYISGDTIESDLSDIFSKYRNGEFTFDEEKLLQGNIDAQYESILGSVKSESARSHIIVVGAVARKKETTGKVLYELADFSCCGEQVDVVAPGVDIFSTTSKGYNNIINIYGKTSRADGTSMAAPHVSGVAALVFGIDPTMDGAEVKSIICETATGSYGDEGYKLVNARAAVEYALGILGSGYCGGEADGKNCSWVLDKNGVLTIRGTGRMADWSFTGENIAPWFPWVSDIKSIIVEDGVTYIGESAFAACSPSSVKLAGSVIEIGDNAFYACFGFEELVLPSALTSIGESAFSNSGIKRITIPDRVTYIDNSAFTGCFSLEKADILGAVTEMNKSFFACSGLKELSLPESLLTIGELTLSGCDSLTDIYYAGSEEQWKRITIHADNDETLRHVNIHYGIKNETQAEYGATTNTTTDSAQQNYLLLYKPVIEGILSELDAHESENTYGMLVDLNDDSLSELIILRQHYNYPYYRYSVYSAANGVLKVLATEESAAYDNIVIRVVQYGGQKALAVFSYGAGSAVMNEQYDVFSGESMTKNISLRADRGYRDGIGSSFYINNEPISEEQYKGETEPLKQSDYSLRSYNGDGGQQKLIDLYYMLYGENTLVFDFAGDNGPGDAGSSENTKTVDYSSSADSEELVYDGKYSRREKADRGLIEYHIPRIRMSSTEIKVINNELEAQLSPVIERSEASYESGGNVECSKINYEFAVNGDILSLVISLQRSPDYGGNKYIVYNISTSGEKVLTSQQLYSSFGLSSDSAQELIRQAAELCWQNTWGNKGNLNKWDEEALRNTLDDKNLSQVQPYLAADGSLNAIVMLYLPVAGGKFYYPVELIGSPNK